MNPRWSPEVLFLITSDQTLQVVRLRDLKCIQSYALNDTVGALLDAETVGMLKAREGTQWVKGEADGGQEWLSLCVDDSASANRLWLGLGSEILSCDIVEEGRSLTLTLNPNPYRNPNPNPNLKAP